MHIEFLTRTEYLRARNRWKKDYLEISHKIRALKAATKLMAKSGYSTYCHVQSVRALLSNEACNMMDELTCLKHIAKTSVSYANYLETSNYMDLDSFGVY